MTHPEASEWQLSSVAFEFSHTCCYSNPLDRNLRCHIVAIECSEEANERTNCNGIQNGVMSELSTPAPLNMLPSVEQILPLREQPMGMFVHIQEKELEWIVDRHVVMGGRPVSE